MENKVAKYSEPKVGKKLPTIAELYDDKSLVIKQNDLNILLNGEPPKEWVHEHPMVKGLKYLPIERVEYLLTCIFVRWESRIKDIKLIANSIVVVVELRCQNPLNSDDWIVQDGVGAAPLQVDKGSGAIEFNKMKNSAVQIGAPAAESYAIKDAAEKLGKLFGKDLNRKDIMAYVDRIETTTEMIEKQEIVEQLESATSLDELQKVWIHIRQVYRDDAYISNLYNLRTEKLGESMK